MSGAAFLEEIVNWDDEERAERVEEALPRLIVSFNSFLVSNCVVPLRGHVSD